MKNLFQSEQECGKIKQSMYPHKGINNEKVFMHKKIESKNCDNVKIFHDFNKPDREEYGKAFKKETGNI